MQHVKIGRSCDECKARKVRCIKSDPSSLQCANCLRRASVCHFSPHKQRPKRAVAGAVPRTESTESPPPPHPPRSQLTVPYAPVATSSQNPPNSNGSQHLPRAVALDAQTPVDPTSEELPKLFMDFLMEDRQLAGRRVDTDSITKASDKYVASSNLTFFSSARLTSLSRRLGHSKVKGIIDTVESVLQEKATTTEKISGDFTAFSQTDSNIEDSDQSRQSFIKSYFENVHPVYPLLDRKVFERQALGPARDQLLAKSAPWFALYYVVLALGSQYQDGGSFDAGRGKAWRLFHKALCRLPEILIPKGTLINAQAVTSMAIFALHFSGMQLDEYLISEAARISRTLGLHNSNCVHGSAQDCSRTFWVIYALEKDFSFNEGMPSAILDCQIGCPIPDVPDSRFGDLDWILTYARLARILSKAYESLFSVTATLKSRDAYYQAIDSVRANLDLWKESLPEEFRPGQPFRRHSMQMPGSVMIAVRIRLAYYNVIITLARLTLHVGNGEPSERQLESVRMLLSAARSILDLTKYLDLEPYTPLWMLGAMPLAALFILFDFVIHNPGHAETKVNLAFLDVAAGHFSRLEFASGGSLPSSLLSEFTHIARQHVQDVASGKRSISPGVMTANNQHDASKEKQENCGATAESTSLPEEMYTFTHDALTNMNVPGSLFLTEMDTALPMEPQNIGFDLMGLFGPVINFASPFDQQVAFQPH